MTTTPERLSCLDCTNCIFSPSLGAYCRIWSEVVPIDFSRECPAWEPA